ncbi:hypothetical protein EHS25_005870 [Saitozyma podzolica]|uniref:FAD dependent oxidoreductase domain-containing protein n=1 Tax=Saitozyma podzolica TaxID=1890683 RepID=A0A427XVM3_9TREE|nr:hypothetical protein EHS25_005870 [Saitozyma podzolica]
MTRIDTPPCLPVANRLESFWLTERDTELQYARTSQEIPHDADVVIVGSGLSGAMMSYHLHKDAEAAGRGLRVVMLEADEVCGSATARNGGHCKPVTFIGYRAEASKRGPEVANHLLTFEEAALGQYAAIVEAEKIECDMHVTRACDVFYREDDAESARSDWEARRAAFPADVQQGDVRIYDDAAEFEQLTGVQGGVFGASYPAGHLWPYKLATSLIRISMSHGMNLQSRTPATELSRAPDGRWIVATPRGDILAKSVVVTTNAYTSSFLPEFKPLIIPVRGTACSITPAPSHLPGSVPGPIKYTYGFRHGPGEVDYMIPRQGRGLVPGQGDRSIILGGAKGCFLHDIDQWYDNINDDVEMPGARAYFEGFMDKYFVGWNGNARGNVDHVWSGVLGYSSDLLPYVGEHPDRPGVFICAGFTGHGMPRIPGCTRALSSLARAFLDTTETIPKHSRAAFDAALPKPYLLSRERLESKENRIKDAMGQGAATKPDEATMLARAMEAKL